jgi:uncharacterized protein (UPF0548 family)
MFVVGRPTLEDLERILASQVGEAVTYPDVGATRGVMPDGYRQDRHEVLLGAGPGVFARAAEGLRRWEAHRGAGMTLCPEIPELREGVTMVQAVALPLISAVAACRIVYVLDEPDAFGFAYGTLPAHPEEGEEAFTVHLDTHGAVTFVVTAFSRPRHPLARLGGPATRQIQLHVTRQYLDALKAAAAG